MFKVLARQALILLDPGAVMVIAVWRRFRLNATSGV